MAEEQHRCQAPPEGLLLCANNCGFFGSPTTMNLCSKCYRDLHLKEQNPSPSLPLPILSPSSSAAPASEPRRPEPEALPAGKEAAAAEAEAGEATATAAAKKSPNRCTACRKRVGLTGFRCKCGDTFCGAHRYPEKHSCDFDFKKAGREEIARANPLVVAEKLQKI